MLASGTAALPRLLVLWKLSFLASRSVLPLETYRLSWTCRSGPWSRSSGTDTNGTNDWARVQFITDKSVQVCAEGKGDTGKSEGDMDKEGDRARRLAGLAKWLAASRGNILQSTEDDDGDDEAAAHAAHGG